MKKNILLVMAAAVAMLFTACKKDLDLTGTTWTSPVNKNITVMGISGTVNATLTLNFIDATNGKLVLTGSISAMGMNIPIPESAATEFTYTFDGENGVLTSGNIVQSFTYNKKTKNISMTIDGDAGNSLSEYLGSDTFVFTQQQ